MNNDSKDVGFYQDFLFTICNLVAMEHHCTSSYGVTKDPIQFELANKARRTRSDLMYRHIKHSDNQIYCEAKHCAGIITGLKEVANRYFELKEEKLAQEVLQEASNWEAVFVLLSQGDKND